MGFFLFIAVETHERYLNDYGNIFTIIVKTRTTCLVMSFNCNAHPPNPAKNQIKYSNYIKLSLLFATGKLNPDSRKETQREIGAQVHLSSSEHEAASVEMLPNPQAPLTGDS